MKFKAFIEVLDRQGRDEYVGYYKTPGGRTFEVWLRVNAEKIATITYLRSYGKGHGQFSEILPLFRDDLKRLGVIDVNYSTAVDDKTGGRARDRLFKRYYANNQKG